MNDFIKGIKDGIPICLGYFSVSFGFGILAVSQGLPAWAAVVISLTNLTSAGQVAGVGVIAEGGSCLEMILTQLIINCRYFLMAIALSQNLSDKFNLGHRFLAAFGITDEIFGVASSKEEPLTPLYMYGMIIIATIGWTMGTLIGAVAGNVFPEAVRNALGILLYGMFIAVIIPPVRKSRANLAVVLIAAAISCILYYGLPQLSSGFSVIICAVISAAILAVLAPVEDKEE